MLPFCGFLRHCAASISIIHLICHQLSSNFWILCLQLSPFTGDPVLIRKLGQLCVPCIQELPVSLVSEEVAVEELKRFFKIPLITLLSLLLEPIENVLVREPVAPSILELVPKGLV